MWETRRIDPKTGKGEISMMEKRLDRWRTRTANRDKRERMTDKVNSGFSGGHGARVLFSRVQAWVLCVCVCVCVCVCLGFRYLVVRLCSLALLIRSTTTRGMVVYHDGHSSWLNRGSLCRGFAARSSQEITRETGGKERERKEEGVVVETLLPCQAACGHKIAPNAGDFLSPKGNKLD
ncbi:uncharacterized protein B0I36DRAFT_7897 [Microdochium trichocladiopsis]|uniref:Uncharacterized protein n=1 Tax=Microdochium trichocladiopsis TaxID=1682393 RepID=A0A9P9BVZ6_9PEZI|nr:uncharacterized protein B0I36DRAFT_7897 [Microdochium trichocladiopsis]KAH7040272.1 hypothetical protein B0I36DRAFT_7897 [Microdochium trichocladiopsis]